MQDLERRAGWEAIGAFALNGQRRQQLDLQCDRRRVDDRRHAAAACAPNTERWASAVWRGIAGINRARLRDEQRAQTARVGDQEGEDGNEQRPSHRDAMVHHSAAAAAASWCYRPFGASPTMTSAPSTAIAAPSKWVVKHIETVTSESSSRIWYRVLVAV